MPATTDLTDTLDEVRTRIDHANPDLQAFVNEPDRAHRLRTEAEQFADRWPDAATRPPLYGVPLGVKDVFRVDGLPTRAGSELPPEALAGPEASAVAKLRAAGAVVVGKTVTAEFAFMGPGPTRNPHNLAHTPGGSSSGSAAAVAAGLVPLALGTQTVGSVIRPAAYCGIFGFKPTYGRISCDGVIANAPTFDTVGMFSPDVAGLEAAAAVLCAGWRPSAAAERRPTLAIPDGPYLAQATPEAQQAFAAQVRRLEAAGLSVRRVAAFADIDEINERNATDQLRRAGALARVALPCVRPALSGRDRGRGTGGPAGVRRGVRARAGEAGGVRRGPGQRRWTPRGSTRGSPRPRPGPLRRGSTPPAVRR